MLCSDRGVTMGRRDYRHKESKKPKKDAKKLSPLVILTDSTTNVEVIKKKGRKKEAGEGSE